MRSDGVDDVENCAASIRLVVGRVNVPPPPARLVVVVVPSVLKVVNWTLWTEAGRFRVSVSDAGGMSACVDVLASWVANHGTRTY